MLALELQQQSPHPREQTRERPVGRSENGVSLFAFQPFNRFGGLDRGEKVSYGTYGYRDDNKFGGGDAAKARRRPAGYARTGPVL